MNLRPPGYEPGELPDCSTPRRGHQDSIRSMPWWTWLCFGIFLLALVAGAIFAVFAFGRFKRLAAAAEGIQARVDEVARLAEEMERRQAHVQGRLEELERHRARTEASIAQLKVLTTALSAARDRTLGLRRRYLRK